MNSTHKHRFFFLVALASILVVVPSLQSQALPPATPDSPEAAALAEFRGKPLPWPGSARPTFSLQRAKEDADGGQRLIWVLRRGGTFLSLDPIVDFEYHEGDPRYSFLFRHQVLTGLRFGLSLFRPGEFLSGTDWGDLTAYLAARRGSLPKEATFTLIQGPDEAQNRYETTFLSAWPKEIIYEVHDPVTKEKYRRSEYFFKFDGFLAVVTYENSPELFERAKPLFLSILNRVEIRRLESDSNAG